MSSRLIIILALAGIAVVGAGASWFLMQPSPTTSAAGTAQPVSDAARREHRERFFSGDPGRDVRGGQELKPRW
ncbi:entry exclusion protein TrbK [Agrobacterium tumefaciens]|uniref:entry exclusion protein TrbK n=1 Tax=Agrobacterium tumefaciens TaxID=358 RepID=UPI001571EE05|nr:entry exclusion protein TrbK [Agrobacterium tumefaciens]NSZ36322.1 entry exclusion protein TrbK [Agrobacterium tumefaciens]NTB21838.1 entry exclusion protein TrbK [Agrobacterium tumefaciens]NTB31816.1 entry exclusion protein TrbK [Agrobacterium tumefaciens]NTB32183.1 entry exclusion protein TrbK [Agrobacterium tumefaciens]